MTTLIISIIVIGLIIGCKFFIDDKIKKVRLDKNTFICKIDPTKSIYYINPDALDHDTIHEFNFVDGGWIKLDGGLLINNTSGRSIRGLISNDKDELKEMVTEILTKRIDNPKYPELIKGELVGIDQFISRDGNVYSSKDVVSLDRLYGNIRANVWDRDSDKLVTTHFELPNELNSSNNSEESRLNGILDSLKRVSEL